MADESSLSIIDSPLQEQHVVQLWILFVGPNTDDGFGFAPRIRTINKVIVTGKIRDIIFASTVSRHKFTEQRLIV